MEQSVIDQFREESDNHTEEEQNFLRFLIQCFLHRKNLMKILEDANRHGNILIPGQSNEYTIATIYLNSHWLITYPDNSILNKIFTQSQQIEFMEKTLKKAKKLGYASLIKNPTLYIG